MNETNHLECSDNKPWAKVWLQDHKNFLIGEFQVLSTQVEYQMFNLNLALRMQVG